jgi:hypothetical protein
MPGQAFAADILTATGLISTGYLIFGKDGIIRALGNACAAIDTGIRIDIHPGPFFHRITGNNALHWTDLDASSIPQTKTGNNIGHCISSKI